MSEHPNVKRFRRAIETRQRSALERDDLAVLEDLFADTVIWHGSPRGGDAEGRTEVIEQWQALARGELGGPAIEVRRVYADDHHGVTEVQFSADTSSGPLSVLQGTAYELNEEAKVSDIWGMPSDAEIVEAFGRGALPDDNPHLALFRIAEDVRNRQTFEPDDIATLERFLDKDVIWHGAGRSQFKDGARPRENVIALYKMFKQVTGGTFGMHYSGMYAGDTHAASFVKLTADFGPKHMNFNEVNLFHLKPDGGTYEFWGIAQDQEEVDSFWD